MSKHELRESAERRRKPYPRAIVSGGAAYVSLWIHEDEWRDLNKLADAYCDEHPPDDDTPADFAWLKTIEESKHDDRFQTWSISNDEGQLVEYRDSDGNWWIRHSPIWRDTDVTRRHVRLLLTALRGECKEGT